MVGWHSTVGGRAEWMGSDVSAKGELGEFTAWGKVREMLGKSDLKVVT